jgi:hypothetical protein
MLMADLAFQTLQTFLAALPKKQKWAVCQPYYNPTIHLKGRSYVLYQEKLVWEEWRQLYVEALKDPNSLSVDQCKDFFRLCRDPDLDYLNAKLGEDHPYSTQWYFEAGQYDVIQSMKSWASSKKDLLSLTYQVTSQPRRKIPPAKGNRPKYGTTRSPPKYEPFPEHTFYNFFRRPALIMRTLSTSRLDWSHTYHDRAV